MPGLASPSTEQASQHYFTGSVSAFWADSYYTWPPGALFTWKHLMFIDITKFKQQKNHFNFKEVIMNFSAEEGCLFPSTIVWTKCHKVRVLFFQAACKDTWDKLDTHIECLKQEYRALNRMMDQPISTLNMQVCTVWDLHVWVSSSASLCDLLWVCKDVYPCRSIIPA